MFNRSIRELVMQWQYRFSTNEFPFALWASGSSMFRVYSNLFNYLSKQSEWL